MQTTQKKMFELLAVRLASINIVQCYSLQQQLPPHLWERLNSMPKYSTLLAVQQRPARAPSTADMPNLQLEPQCGGSTDRPAVKDALGECCPVVGWQLINYS
jgi:hypothetical protein